MEKIKIFQNAEFGKIRVVEQNGEPWFVAKDVCEALGYTNPRKAVHDHVEPEDKGVTKQSTPGGAQEMTIINESGLYSLIFSSQLQKAKAFKKWVTSEVLPSIRRHGIYATDNVIEKIIQDPDFGISLLRELKEERQKRIEAEQTNAILMHVRKTYTTTEIAKELGMKSARQLNNILRKEKIQFKLNGTWVLYSQYADNGYVEIKQEALDNGKVIYDRRWTQRGREFIIKRIKRLTEK